MTNELIRGDIMTEQASMSRPDVFGEQKIFIFTFITIGSELFFNLGAVAFQFGTYEIRLS